MHESTPSATGQPAPNKLATFLWFLRRPEMHAHLLEMLRRRISPGCRALERSRPQAMAWAQERALNPQQVLAALFGPGPYPSPEAIHPVVFGHAHRRARESGAAMGGPANLTLLYHIVLRLPAREVLETGVAFGWSSLTILLAQQQGAGGRLVSIDMPYPRGGSEAFVGCVVPDDLAPHWTLIRKPDRPALPRALRASAGSIDLVHYDSDKTYAGQRWALDLIWASLRPGGVLVIDDIDQQAAFRDFTETLDAEPLVADGGGKYVGIIRKPSGAAPGDA